MANLAICEDDTPAQNGDLDQSDDIMLTYSTTLVTPLAQLGSDTTPAYRQVDIIGLVVTIVSSHITTANGLAAACTSIIIMTTSYTGQRKLHVDKV